MQATAISPAVFSLSVDGFRGIRLDDLRRGFPA